MKLDPLEAQLRPVEHLDKRHELILKGKIPQQKVSVSQDWMPFNIDVQLTYLKRLE